MVARARGEVEGQEISFEPHGSCRRLKSYPNRTINSFLGELLMRKMILLDLRCQGCFVESTVRGQTQDSPSEKPDRPEIRRESACHLEFSINELEDGKKINVRHYSMNLSGRRPSQSS